MATVQYKEATRVYPGTDRAAVSKLDLDIGDGEFMVLVGPSGCGKSTSLRMLAGLEEVNAGSIWIGDRDVTDLPPKDRDIAMVFQNYALYPHMTVADNMGFALKMQNVPKAERQQRVLEAAKLLGLEDFLNRKPKALSGGQRQRAYVAMVLCQETDYVLLDEPLNNLDISHSVEMMQHLHSAAREFGRTIVIVLHDINFAARYADYICAAKDGQVFAFGTVEEIMRDDLLTEIFNTPVQVIDGPHGPIAAYH